MTVLTDDIIHYEQIQDMLLTEGWKNVQDSTSNAIGNAFVVATITAASGDRPAFLHLISKNFSAPKSAPKPASVTT